MCLPKVTKITTTTNKAKMEFVNFLYETYARLKVTSGQFVTIVTESARSVRSLSMFF